MQYTDWQIDMCACQSLSGQNTHRSQVFRNRNRHCIHNSSHWGGAGQHVVHRGGQEHGGVGTHPTPMYHAVVIIIIIIISSCFPSCRSLLHGPSTGISCRLCFRPLLLVIVVLGWHLVLPCHYPMTCGESSNDNNRKCVQWCLLLGFSMLLSGEYPHGLLLSYPSGSFAGG